MEGLVVMEKELIWKGRDWEGIDVGINGGCVCLVMEKELMW